MYVAINRKLTDGAEALLFAPRAVRSRRLSAVHEPTVVSVEHVVVVVTFFSMGSSRRKDLRRGGGAPAPW
jgi:hypothetical protein